MLVWEGDHFATVHHFKREHQEKMRGEECDRPQAGSAVDDRVMLTAGREYCRRSNDAHGRTPGVL